MMTLEEHRKHLRWSLAKLAREADLDAQTVYKAIAGETVRENTATKLLSALNKAYSRQENPLKASDIEGLQVK